MKTVTIEELLCWAFVHELPKGGGVDGLANANSAWRMLQASSWGKVTAFAELMALIDTSPGGGNYFIEQGEPHDDALALGEAVAELAHMAVDIPAGWAPLSDWPAADDTARRLIGEAVARAVGRWSARSPVRRAAHLVSLVVGTAVLGRAPVHDAPMPKIRMVTRVGKPAWFRMITVKDDLGQSWPREVDGFNARTGRRHPGAYRKYEFADDPAGDVLGRLDWQLWVAALDRLERVVAPRLVAHRLRGHGYDACPWGGDGRAVRLVESAAAPARKKSFAAH